MKAVQRTALREAGFAEPQMNALAMALEPLATKEDLKGVVEVIRYDLEAIRNDLRWIKMGRRSRRHRGAGRTGRRSLFLEGFGSRTAANRKPWDL